jgi:hypothetical protein
VACVGLGQITDPARATPEGGKGGDSVGGGQEGGAPGNGGTSNTGGAVNAGGMGDIGGPNTGGCSGADCFPNPGGGMITGAPGVWEPAITPPAGKTICGEGVLVDPARASDFYFFYEETHCNGNPRHVMKSTDFGKTWTQIDKTPMRGDAWGNAIDPNPKRDPGTPPTMYTPAGYADNGLWKSTDGGVIWTNLFKNGGTVPKTGGGTVTFPLDGNRFNTDFYQVHILPDNPPNHILITYHYGTPGQTPLGESTDGGQSWVVHILPAGGSHYVYGVSANTWLLISGTDDGPGIFRTTTAGRVNGAISVNAWQKVDGTTHAHGAFTPWKDPNSANLYFPTGRGILRTGDGGATWTPIYNVGQSTLVVTAKYFYASSLFQPPLLRAPFDNPSTWMTIPNPTNAAFGKSWDVVPYGAAASFDGKNWVIVQATYSAPCCNSPVGKSGYLWRYVEP